jgi:hypothetical protein
MSLSTDTRHITAGERQKYMRLEDKQVLAGIGSAINQTPMLHLCPRRGSHGEGTSPHRLNPPHLSTAIFRRSSTRVAPEAEAACEDLAVDARACEVSSEVHQDSDAVCAGDEPILGATSTAVYAPGQHPTYTEENDASGCIHDTGASRPCQLAQTLFGSLRISTREFRSLPEGPKGCFQQGGPRIDMHQDDERDRKTSSGLVLDQELMTVLEAYCCVSTLGQASQLDRSFHSRFAWGLDGASVKSVLFTSHPLTAGATKRWIQFNFSMFAVAYLAAGAAFALQVQLPAAVWPVTRFRHFRYTNFFTKNGSVATTPGVTRFGLIQSGGCSAEINSTHTGIWGSKASTGSSSSNELSAPALYQVDGTSIYVSYAQAVDLYGWYLDTDGSEGTSYFEVHAAAELPRLPRRSMQPTREFRHDHRITDDAMRTEGEDSSGSWFGGLFNLAATGWDARRNHVSEQEVWLLVGTPVWRLNVEYNGVVASVGRTNVFTSVRADVAERGRVVFDPRPSWMWILYKLVRFLLLAGGSLGYTLMGMLRFPVGARVVLAAFHSAIIATSLTAAAAYALAGRVHNCAEVVLVTVPVLFLVWGMVSERTTLKAWFLTGITDIVMTLSISWLYHTPSIADLPYFGIGHVTLVAVILLGRWSALTESVRLVKPDQVSVH